MPEKSEEFIEYLLSIDRLDEAALRLADVINSEDFVSAKGKSKHTVSCIVTSALQEHNEIVINLISASVVERVVRFDVEKPRPSKVGEG